MGAAAPGKASFAGQMGLIALFAVAATPKEVEALHAATAGPHALLEPELQGVPVPPCVAQLGGGVPPRLLAAKRGAKGHTDCGLCFSLDCRRCEGSRSPLPRSLRPAAL